MARRYRGRAGEGLGGAPCYHRPPMSRGAARRARPRRKRPAPARAPAAPAPRRASGAKGLVLLLAALAPLIVYWPTTHHGLLLDDVVLFRSSPSLRDLATIPAGFVHDVGTVRKGAAAADSSYYRPLFLALSTLYYRLGGGSDGSWHLAAVLLAAAVAAAAAAVFLRLGFPPLASLLGALLFSLHPSHVSSIAWVSGLQELLAALFSLLAFLALLAFAGGHGRRALAAAAACYGLALLCKEVALALLPLVLAWAFLLRRSPGGEARRLLRAAVVLGVVAAGYLAARLVALGGAFAHPWPHAPGLAASLVSVPYALATYLRLLLWPAAFSILRPERPVASLLAPAAWVSFLVVGALAGLAVVVARRHPETALPLVWLVVWLLPVLNLWALNPQWMVSDRYLFLPSLALPWLLLVLLPRRLATPLLALLIVASAALTLRYAAIFANEPTFLAAMERAEPTSSLVLDEKARLLAQDGKPAAAQAAWMRALAVDAGDERALQALGDGELGAGNLGAAEGYYRRLVAEQPDAILPFKRLVLAWAEAGNREKAAALLAEAVARWPADFQLQLLHAVWLAGAGDHAGALQAYAAAQHLRPGDPDLAGSLDGAISRLGPLLSPRVPPPR